MAIPSRSHTMTLALPSDYDRWCPPMLGDLPTEENNAIKDQNSVDLVGEHLDSGNSSNDDGDDYYEVLALPEAHSQLLSDDPSSLEDLKGYDHTRMHGFGSNFNRIQDQVDDCDDFDFAVNKPSDSFIRRRIQEQKRQQNDQRSGGSWLLGFVSLDDSVRPERPGGRLLDDFPSGVSLSSDECSSEESDDDSLPNNSLHSSNTISSNSIDKSEPARRGVSFNSAVTVQPIPHSCTLSFVQRRRMFTGTEEVRRNKARNKREFRHDGCDWRRATEEWEMRLDMATGELVHPAHDVDLQS